MLAQMRKSYLRGLADLQYVLGNQDEFEWDDPKDVAVATLNDASRQFVENLATIQGVARAITRDLETPITGVAALAAVPDVDLPTRKPGVIEEAPPADAQPPEPVSLKDALARSRLDLAGSGSALTPPASDG